MRAAARGDTPKKSPMAAPRSDACMTEKARGHELEGEYVGPKGGEGHSRRGQGDECAPERRQGEVLKHCDTPRFLWRKRAWHRRAREAHRPWETMSMDALRSRASVAMTLMTPARPSASRCEIGSFQEDKLRLGGQGARAIWTRWYIGRLRSSWMAPPRESLDPCLPPSRRSRLFDRPRRVFRERRSGHTAHTRRLP